MTKNQGSATDLACEVIEELLSLNLDEVADLDRNLEAPLVEKAFDCCWALFLERLEQLSGAAGISPGGASEQGVAKLDVA